MASHQSGLVMVSRYSPRLPGVQTCPTFSYPIVVLELFGCLAAIKFEGLFPAQPWIKRRGWERPRLAANASGGHNLYCRSMTIGSVAVKNSFRTRMAEAKLEI